MAKKGAKDPPAASPPTADPASEDALRGDEEGLSEAEAADASKEKREQNKALDSITDHVEERQLDSRRVEQAMATIAKSAAEARDAQMRREKELAAVRITAAHIDIVASELEVDKKLAEQRLREYKGDAVAAMRSFLN